MRQQDELVINMLKIHGLFVLCSKIQLFKEHYLKRDTDNVHIVDRQVFTISIINALHKHLIHGVVKGTAMVLPITRVCS